MMIHYLVLNRYSYDVKYNLTEDNLSDFIMTEKACSFVYNRLYSESIQKSDKALISEMFTKGDEENFHLFVRALKFTDFDRRFTIFTIKDEAFNKIDLFEDLAILKLFYVKFIEYCIKLISLK